MAYYEQYRPGADLDTLSVRYFPLILSARTVHLYEIVMDQPLRSGFQNEGLTPDLSVSSREDLLAKLTVWARLNGDRLARPWSADRSFVIGAGDEERDTMTARLEQERCLAAAGHPSDPAVLDLHPRFQLGVLITAVDTREAIARCEWAEDDMSVPSASYALARALLRDEEFDRAEAILTALADRDFPFAHIGLADMAIMGHGRPADGARGRAILEATAHHPEVAAAFATYLLGGGLGISDDERALELAEYAMDAGVRTAYRLLGYIYEVGRGVPADMARAVAFYREGADAGDMGAVGNLGRAYYFGLGVNEDIGRAFALLDEAAAHGVPEALYLSGYMLAYGQGTAIDEDEALARLEAAAQAGHEAARTEHARILDEQSAQEDVEVGSAAPEHGDVEIGSAVPGREDAETVLWGLDAETAFQRLEEELQGLDAEAALQLIEDELRRTDDEISRLEGQIQRSEDEIQRLDDEIRAYFRARTWSFDEAQPSLHVFAAAEMGTDGEAFFAFFCVGGEVAPAIHFGVPLDSYGFSAAWDEHFRLTPLRMVLDEGRIIELSWLFEDGSLLARRIVRGMSPVIAESEFIGRLFAPGFDAMPNWDWTVRDLVGWLGSAEQVTVLARAGGVFDIALEFDMEGFRDGIARMEQACL